MALEVNDINSDITSATTIFSANTNLQQIIQDIASGLSTPSSLNLKNGLNTYTGGTSSLPTINLSGGTFDNLNVSGTSSFSTVSGTSFFSAGTNFNSIFKTETIISIPVHAVASTSVTLTSQVLAEQFFANSARNLRLVDLSGYTKCKIEATVSTPSVSANNPRLLLKGRTGVYSSLVSDYVTLGVAGQEVSIILSGVSGIHRSSGWQTLNLTARTNDVAVALTQIGGNASASPVIGNVIIYFE